MLGLVGGPLVFASGAAQMFGLYGQISVWAAITAVPVFAWEICLALYLIVPAFGRGETQHSTGRGRRPPRSRVAQAGAVAPSAGRRN